ncbi:MAG: hypothetical protein HYW80_01195 [Parcubacteria group bacterium]|nr:hypothetical protein [Parcubacteria group bacterium]
MKFGLKAVLILIFLGGLTLVGLASLGKNNELSLSFGKKAATGPSPDSLPKEFVVSEEQNYTRKLAEKFARQIIAKNEVGPQAGADGLAVVLNPQEILDEMLRDPLTAEMIALPTFFEKDFNVVPDSKDASQRYTDTLQRSINTALGDWANDNPLILFYQAIPTSDYQKLISLYERLAIAEKEFKTMPVPKSWFEFHRKTFILLTQTENLIPKFINWQSDPLAALIGLETYQIMGDKTQELLNEFATRAKKEGLL